MSNFLDAAYKLPKPSKDRFSRILIKALYAAGIRGTIQYDPEKFRLIFDEEEETAVCLTNVYKKYCTTSFLGRKSLLNWYLDRVVQAQPERPIVYAEAKSHLLPRVRNRFDHEATRLEHQIESTHILETPHRLIADQFALELACDFPDMFQSISDTQLRRWNIDFDDVMKTARDNLWRMSNESFHQPQKGIFVSPWQDKHDPSRLILHDLIWQLDVKGDHVAMIPNQNHLIITGSDDTPGLLRMAALAEALIQEDRPISGIAIQLIGNKWETYLPEQNHPAYLLFNNLRVQSIAYDYYRQRQLLEPFYIKNGEDVNVANVLPLQEQATEASFTSAVWTEGVNTLLPRVDKIGFIRTAIQSEGEILGVAEWDNVMNIVGDMMQPIGMYPERYRVTTFPTQEQLSAMDLSMEPCTVMVKLY